MSIKENDIWEENKQEMEKTIVLNDQQITFLADFLNFHLNENEWISGTSKSIIQGLLVKLLEE